MNKDKDSTEGTEADASGPTRHVTGEPEKAKARKWFAHAKAVSESKNYDYAVELYVNGLALWPEAMDEGLKPLRVCATARRLNGGKPAGFLEAKKRSTGGKDAPKALNNALYLFGKDPVNVGHMEHILKAAARASCDGTVRWIAPVLVEGLMHEKKLPEKRYAECCDAIESAAELAITAGDYVCASEILQAGLRAAQIWLGHFPNSQEAQHAYSSASSRQTIVKGRFGSGDDFRESLKDADEQRDLRDRDKVVRSVDRDAELIARVRRDWEENPGVAAKLLTLVDLLIRKEDDAIENEAIELVEAEYATNGAYNMKVKADDIRMRQTKRHVRRLVAKVKANPKNTDMRKALAVHLARQNKMEVAIFRERAKRYPTDMRIRFSLGTRLFKAKRYDEAIPMFQQAQSDGRHRADSRLYLGRCFHEKGFETQAVEILSSALDDVESKTGDMAKDLSYWLARAQEAAGKPEDARNTYGHLIQLDYNYRDARKRLEALSAADEGAA